MMTTDRPEDFTHHVWYEYIEGRSQRAIRQAMCGVFIRQGESVPHPTCPRCRRMLATKDQAVPPALPRGYGEEA